MTCPSCRAQNDDDAVTCRRCAATLGPLATGAVVADRYEILEPLGKGGMGMVFKARDRVLEDLVALKVLRPEVAGTEDMARRFRGEIKLARRVSHKNVCRIHEYGEDAGLRYISMTFVDGVDLKRTLRQRGALPPAEAFAIAIQVAQGLEAIHDEGIIHRDLKAPNVMIDRRGVVRLMDFGIAKAADTGTTPTMTATGMIVGTPEYMSPEQGRGDKVDRRSDLYSLGVVVFELFTGRVPFKGDTPIATIIKHMQEPPPLAGEAARGLPAPLLPVLRKALAKDPGQRYTTAAEMTEALTQARDAVTGPAVDAETTSAASRRTVRPHPEVPLAAVPAPPRRWWAWAGAAGLAVAAGGGLAYWHGPDPLPPPGPMLPVTTAPTTTTPMTTTVPAPTLPPTTVPAPTLPPRPPPTTVTTSSTLAPRPSPRVVVPPATMPAAVGYLQVVIVPWAEVLVDGARVATAPLRKIPLAPGPHVVRLLHPDYQPLQRRVVIRAGHTENLSVDLPEEGVRKQPVRRY